MNSPFRIVICIPSLSTWCADTALSIIGMVDYEARKGTGLAITNVQGSVITQARNQLVRRALSMEPPCTHILFVDSDMLFPYNSLERLLVHDKDAVGAFYSRRMPPYSCTGTLADDSANPQSGLHLAHLMPHGLFLVKREVYVKLPAPWYYETHDPGRSTEADPFGWTGEDTNFTRNCLRAGINVYCDLDLTAETGHIGDAIYVCPDSSSSTTSNGSDSGASFSTADPAACGR